MYNYGTIIEQGEQGDPAAIEIYAIAVIPLIFMLVEATLKTSTVSAGYADDLTAAGMVRGLKIWWDKLSELGPEDSDTSQKPQNHG